MSEKNEKQEDINVDFLNALAGQGFEGMTAGDFPVPFLKILTNGTPECTKGREAFIKGAEPGMFLDTSNKQLYASLDVIPLRYENIWTEFEPNRGPFKGRHVPFSIPVIGDSFVGMKTKEGNDIIENSVFYVLVCGELRKGPRVLSLKSTGIRHAKNWNQKIKDLRLPANIEEMKANALDSTSVTKNTGNPAPYYGAVWHLELFLNENDSGAWYTLGVKKETKITFVRWISRGDYNEYVGAEVKRLQEQKPQLSIADLRGDDADDEARSAGSKDF